MMKVMNIAIVMLFVSMNIKANTYNILNFGAKNDTAYVSTIAINSAIEACHKAGGGTVLFPPGEYKSGTIVLKDNVHLFFEKGAVLYASTEPGDFPRQAQPAYRSQKDDGGWYALIYGEGLNNIGITGFGTIDGQGAKQKSRPECLKGDRDGRPRNILFISCSNINISGITLLNSGMWAQHYLDCEDVFIDKIKVFNHSNKNNDGIDIDGCRRVVLTNSVIDSDDDGIVLKSTGIAPCEEIIISGCVVSSYNNAIKLGTESTGGFKNISISDCIIKPTRTTTKSVFNSPRIGASGISLEIVDGGVMDGVTVNNIIIEGTMCPLYVRLANRARKHIKEAPEPPLGAMKNIMISNIMAYNVGTYSSSITGVPGAKIENISVSNFRIRNNRGLKGGEFIPHFSEVVEDEKGYPSPGVWKNLPCYGLFIRHVKDIAVNNIELYAPENEVRVPLIAIDVNDLKISGFRKSHHVTDIILSEVEKYTIEPGVNVIFEDMEH